MQNSTNQVFLSRRVNIALNEGKTVCFTLHWGDSTENITGKLIKAVFPGESFTDSHLLPKNWYWDEKCSYFRLLFEVFASKTYKKGEFLLINAVWHGEPKDFSVSG